MAPDRKRRLSFWDVDTQVDFLSRGGKLYVPGSETILPNLERLTRWAAHCNVLVVASVCAHRASDAEFRSWPPHCLVGTEGQRKIPETTLPRRTVIPNHRVVIPAKLDSWQQILLEKQELDVFTNPNIERVLERLARPEIVLYGVVTEICVALTARRLLENGYLVRLVQDATCALEEAKGREFLGEFVRQGGSLAVTDEIGAELSKEFQGVA